MQDWDWFNGRNFCRDRCMDLVSFDRAGEFEMFQDIMQKGRIVHKCPARSYLVPKHSVHRSNYSQTIGMISIILALFSR